MNQGVLDGQGKAVDGSANEGKSAADLHCDTVAQFDPGKFFVSDNVFQIPKEGLFGAFNIDAVIILVGIPVFVEDGAFGHQGRTETEGS